MSHRLAKKSIKKSAPCLCIRNKIVWLVATGRNRQPYWPPLDRPVSAPLTTAFLPFLKYKGNHKNQSRIKGRRGQLKLEPCSLSTKSNLLAFRRRVSNHGLRVAVE